MTATKRARPTLAQIREAAKRFPSATAVVDGLHPRQISILPDSLLEYVADLFEIWEVAGCPILPEQTLMVKMIPKPAGDFRPIGLYPALYRVWGKMRQPALKAWAVKMFRMPK